MRITFVHAAQAHQLEYFVNPLPAFGLSQVGQTKGHVVRHIKMRKKRVVLKHHADAALFGGDMDLVTADHFVCQQDAALLSPFEAGNGAQQSGFSAARRPDQHTYFARHQTERYPVDGGVRTARVMHDQMRNVQKHGFYCRCLQFSFAMTG